MAAVDAALMPGAFLVDAFPIRKRFNKGLSPKDLKTFAFLQLSMSQNGSPELASRGSRGRRRKILISWSIFLSTTSRNLSRFASHAHSIRAQGSLLMRI